LLKLLEPALRLGWRSPSAAICAGANNTAFADP
jgi:hypothetical protein